ncbi:MAG TPA: tRNA pseudouridine(55) synthase TruB [Terriglobales bacterium]
MDGALIIHKPAGVTSHDVVARVRRICQERSVGHLGTLDPSASGVLPLLLGRLTRLAQFFQGRDKEYAGEIRFGWATDTYDAAGKPVGEISSRQPTREEVESALPRFRGRLQQVPPAYSAKKIDGVPAYKLARREKPVTLAAVEVEVSQFDMTAMAGDRMRFHVTCSTGTYVRSLAHELGAALGVGAHLSELQRVRVGEFSLAASYTLDALGELAAAGELDRALLPALRLLPEFPAVFAPAEAAGYLLQGRAANLGEFSQAPLVRVFTHDQRLLAIARRLAGSLFQPQIVFPGA